MTIQNEVYRKDYAGNGVTTSFPVDFYFFDDTHLRVILRAVDQTETDQVLNTDYTVIGAGVPSGGSVEMVTPPASGEQLIILRNVPITQLIDYEENDNFPAESHESGLDKMTMIIQQQQEQLDRSITVSEGYPVAIQLPGPEANKALVWNAAGDQLENSQFDPDEQAILAAASASAAATSEANANTSESNAAASENKAQLWANELEDVEVEPGLYSAYHWALKALQAATGFPSGTRLFFQQAVPPPGWVLQDVGDCVLGVSNGTTQLYAGAQPGVLNAGNWSFTVSISVNGSVTGNVSSGGVAHNHQWYDYDPTGGDDDRSWDSNGSTQLNLRGAAATGAKMVVDDGASGNKLNRDLWTQDTISLHSHGAGTLAFAGSDSDTINDFRAEAATGIVAQQA